MLITDSKGGVVIMSFSAHHRCNNHFRQEKRRRCSAMHAHALDTRIS